MLKEKHHILIIDDNEDILFMLKAMLEMRGFNITPQDSPENIELFIETISPDLILMDMLLSGADGREVCKKIKMNKAIAHIPIIMISALPDADVSCLEAGTDYFLGKPFEMTDLFNTVEKALLPVNI